MSSIDYPVDTPIPLPKLGSWPPAVHVFASQERDALLAAEAANRPLLVRGEPGTGKSQLARGRLFLSVVVNARAGDEGLAAQVLLALFDPIRHAFGDHDRRGVRIGTHHIGHDRGVDHPQALQTVHPAILVHHSHGV
jgi:hypothetical protein